MMTRAKAIKPGPLNEAEEVRKSFQVLQDAYLKRNLKRIDYVVKEIFPKDGQMSIIGTSGLLPGKEEWPQDSERSKELVLSDWRTWGDVYFNVAGARIRLAGAIAWLESNGFVEKVLPADQVCENHLKYIRTLLDGDMPAKEKVAEISRGASNVVQEMLKGDRYIWPMRFTAVLERLDERWVFRQMHFSFPTTRFPDERISVIEVEENEDRESC